MAIDNSKGLLTGILIGVGASFLARRGLEPLLPVLRPLAKQGMKTAMHGYERGRELAAHLAETLSDMAAEVEAEMEAERAAAISSNRDAPAIGSNGRSATGTDPAQGQSNVQHRQD